MLVQAADCPDSTHDLNVASDCFTSTLRPGTQDAVAPMFCEGDGECGTSNVINNCPHGDDMYRLISCTGDFIIEYSMPSPPPPATPPWPPTLPPSLPIGTSGSANVDNGASLIMACIWSTVAVLAAALCVLVLRRRQSKLGLSLTGRRLNTDGGKLPLAYNPQFSLSSAETAAVVTELTEVPPNVRPVVQPLPAATGPVVQSPLQSPTAEHLDHI